MDGNDQLFRQDYTHLADDYDLARFHGTKGAFNTRADARIIDELVGLAGASVILDVPTGTGRICDYLAHRDVEVVGCDLTNAMLHKAAMRRRPPKTLIRCDASQLPFQSGAVECVTCLRFFHLIPHGSRAAIASELSRVLAPQGHLICSFTNGWYAGGVSWLKKAVGRNPLHLLKPGELPTLFPGFCVRAVRGNFWPLQRYSRLLGELAETWSHQMNRYFPLNRMCWEVFYLLQKTA